MRWFPHYTQVVLKIICCLHFHIDWISQKCHISQFTEMEAAEIWTVCSKLRFQQLKPGQHVSPKPSFSSLWIVFPPVLIAGFHQIGLQSWLSTSRPTLHSTRGTLLLTLPAQPQWRAVPTPFRVSKGMFLMALECG